MPFHLKGAAAGAQYRVRITLDQTSTNGIRWSGHYADAPNPLTPSSNIGPDANLPSGAITTTTPTVVCDGPTSSGNTRALRAVSGFNDDATVTHTGEIDLYDGTNSSPLFKFSLAAGESMVLDDTPALTTYDTAGRQKLAPGPGSFVGMTVLTSGTTFTTGSTTSKIKVRVHAGGGGGGGCSSAASQAAYGGGGAEGGYAEKVFSVNPSTGYTYAIGAAGAAGANTGGTGGTGGNSTFTVGATTVTANGGLGGVGMTTGTSHICAAGGASPAVSTNGDFNAGGTPGGASHRSDGTNAGQSGQGGGQGGGASRTTGGAGVAALTNSGAGGGGGAVLNGSGAVTGGAGGAGWIIVEEFT